MSEESQNTGDAPVLDCEEALKRVHGFALGNLPPIQVRELRQHILGCSTCRVAYKEAIETTASFAHVSKQEREEQEIERTKRRIHAERFGPTAEVVKHRRFYRLRIALIPAFFIFLMLKVTGLGEPPARVDLVATDGTVQLEKDQVLVTEDPILILPGRWLHTSTFSSANLVSRDVTVELGSRTTLLLESARPVRMRLRRGQLDIEGDLIIYSMLGMLHVSQGKGRVTLNSDGLLIEAESGGWKLLDKSGETPIKPGPPHLVQVPILAAK